MPQLAGSRVVSAQKRDAPAPQVVSVVAQVVVHMPAEQTSPSTHARPHMPQLARSVSTTTQTSGSAAASAPASPLRVPTAQAI